MARASMIPRILLGRSPGVPYDSRRALPAHSISWRRWRRTHRTDGREAAQAEQRATRDHALLDLESIVDPAALSAAVGRRQAGERDRMRRSRAPRRDQRREAHPVMRAVDCVSVYVGPPMYRRCAGRRLARRRERGADRDRKLSHVERVFDHAVASTYSPAITRSKSAARPSFGFHRVMRLSLGRWIVITDK